MNDGLQPARRYCKECDYDLAASPGRVCPECGRAFSPGDPKSFRTESRRSWRGRWKRWRWLAVPLGLLAAVWPRGWSATKIAWVDSTNASTVTATALVIGRPWWLGGWHAPIVWGTTTGMPPAPLGGPQSIVMFTDDLWLCGSPWLWRSKSLGTGRLTLFGPSAEAELTQSQWQTDIEEYVRTLARATGAASAEAESMSIVTKITPWDQRLPVDRRMGPR